MESYGYAPHEAFEALGLERDDAEADFVDLVERVEENEGRTLTPTERYRLAELDARAELTGEEDLDVSGALLDLDSSDGRAAFISERLEAEPERTEPSANVHGADGEVRPGFNLDQSDERAAAIDALMDGEDVAAYDSSFTTIEGRPSARRLLY